MSTPTFMRREIEEIPAAARRLLASGGPALAEAGARLRERQPAMIATIARGSSDHAASFLKYTTELLAGVPVASIGPSVASVYGRRLRLEGCAALAISQSGKSPDIVAMTQSARESGALTLALTNAANSPLAAAADLAVDLAAGEERSVAATKSFVNSVVAGLAVIGHWTGDADLLRSIDALPDVFEEAIGLDWSPLHEVLADRDSLFVLGRGPALAVAQEAALKFKETCGLHAEAYSAAEVLHGPARIVADGFPVLALTVPDAAEQSVAEVADRLARQGAAVCATTTKIELARQLPAAAASHPVAAALALVVSFYAFVEGLSRHLGYDPDNPPHLRKVTETV